MLNEQMSRRHRLVDNRKCVCLLLLYDQARPNEADEKKPGSGSGYILDPVKCCMQHVKKESDKPGTVPYLLRCIQYLWGIFLPFVPYCMTCWRMLKCYASPRLAREP